MRAPTKRTFRLGGLAAFASLAVLALGATSAFAHGGPGGFGGPGGRGGPFGGAKADLITPAAKTLGVTTDALKKAILDVANAKVDAAVKAEKIDADDAADIKDDISTRPQLAIPLTSATAVAGKLGITKAKLDDAFRAARKAAITANVDQALKDGKIDATKAAAIKADLEDADLPGYKPFMGLAGLGGGPGGPPR